MSSPSTPRTPPSAEMHAPAARRRRPLAKSLLLLIRTLHIYVTMCGLILLIFFSVTGFILNNGASNDDSGTFFHLDTPTFVSDTSAAVPVNILAGNEHFSAIEQFLRNNLGAKGERHATPDEDDTAIHFQFVGPGRRLEYTIDKTTGQTKVHLERNLLATLTDLHTGAHTGRAWTWFIDATAIFLFFAGVSGLILWLSLPKRRLLGLIALVISTLLCVGAYLFLVP